MSGPTCPSTVDNSAIRPFANALPRIHAATLDWSSSRPSINPENASPSDSRRAPSGTNSSTCKGDCDGGSVKRSKRPPGSRRTPIQTGLNTTPRHQSINPETTGSTSASPSAACCAASYAVRCAARYAFCCSRIGSRTARVPTFFEEFHSARRGSRPRAARCRHSSMTAAYGRTEVPELSVDNREPIVQEREAVLVEVGVPPDLETAGGGLAQVEIPREFLSQSLSRISVAPTRQQTYIRRPTERQSRFQGPCTNFRRNGGRGPGCKRAPP